MVRRALPLAFLLLLAPAAFADYVVLSGVAEDDPYFEAARLIAKHRDADAIVRFDPEAPDAVLPRLRELAPANVAIVVRPEQIHVNSVRRILRMAAAVDDDPFPDFAYGFLTGATAEEAVAFVRRIVRADGKPAPAVVGRAAVWGGTGASEAGDGTYLLGGRRLPERWMRFRAPDGERDRDAAFIAKHLPRLAGCGAVLMGGHGMPWEIGSGPRAEDLAGLDLFPAVVVNYACYTGVTRDWPESRFAGTGYGTRIRQVEPERSFAFAMLRAGVTGYVAYVNPRPAGPEMTIDFERILAGQTLGEVRRNDQAKVVLGYLGFGEPGIVPPEYVDGATVPREKMDPVRHMMLDGATGGILYGDPAFRPYRPAPEILPLTIEVRRSGDELAVTLRMTAASAGAWCADPFRRFGEKSMAQKLYGRVELPGGFPIPKSVRVESATRAGRPLDSLPPVWAVEEDRGKRWLHVKAGFAYGGAGAIEIRLVASPDAAPPDVAKPEECRALAVQAGEAILGKLDAIEKPEAYDGAAGVALFLFELSRATGEKRWIEPATRLLTRAIAEAEGPGLYTGRAGVGQVCLDAARITGDPSWIARAERIAAGLGEPEATDVISGAAGTGVFLLNLAAATGKPEPLAAATALGEYLEKRAVREDGRARWPVSERLPRFYVGLSHGAAGIGLFLEALGRATGEERFSTLAREAAAFVLACAKDDGPDGLMWAKLEPPADGNFPVQWCHGSPGIGLFFLAMADATGDPAYEAALARCVAADRRRGMTARANGSQCHGVSGNAELFVEAWRSRRDDGLLATAREFARRLVGPEGLVVSLRGGEYGPGYMTGLAGIGRYFLRLADPEGVPMAFFPARGGPDPVLEKVRAANRAALRPGAESDRAIAELRGLGARGFRAVCRLIAAGEGHWRTHELLRATWTPGAEAELIRLADGPELPGYGRWTALRGLGVADTKEVRAYLLDRVATERNAGLFFSAAEALAMLAEPRAVAPVAKALLEFRPGWSGVETHLVTALARMGPGAADPLEKFLADDRATNAASVLSALRILTSLAPEKARAAASTLRSSPRYAAFPAALRTEIDRLSNLKGQ